MFDTQDKGDANYNWSSPGVEKEFAAPSPSTLLQSQPRRPRLEQHVLYITADPGHKPGNAELKVQFYNQAVKPVMQGSDRGSVRASQSSSPSNHHEDRQARQLMFEVAKGIF